LISVGATQRSTLDEVRFGEEFDRVAELAGVFKVLDIERIDADAGNFAPIDPCTEGEVGEDRQLLGRVTPIHIHRRVGFGITQPLGLGDGVGVGGAEAVHLGQDVIARAVQDPFERFDGVGRKALGNVRDDRDPAGDGRFESDRAAEFAGQGEEFGAMFGEDRLVRRDDVFPRFQEPDHDRAGRFEAADEVGDDLDFGVAVDLFDIIGQDPGREFHAAVFGQVADNGLFQPEGSSGVPRGPVAMIQQQSCDATADGPQAHNCHFGLTHRSDRQLYR
jgi:hypothetical protein